MLKRMFPSKEIKWKREETIQLPFVGMVIPVEEEYDSNSLWSFLIDFTEELYRHGMCVNKKATLLKYWYDGPWGNVGLDFWESGLCKLKTKEVIAITELTKAEHEDVIHIAKQIVDELKKKSNVILLIPKNDEEIKFYNEHFPEAVPISM